MKSEKIFVDKFRQYRDRNKCFQTADSKIQHAKRSVHSNQLRIREFYIPTFPYMPMKLVKKETKQNQAEINGRRDRDAENGGNCEHCEHNRHICCRENHEKKRDQRISQETHMNP